MGSEYVADSNVQSVFDFAHKAIKRLKTQCFIRSMSCVMMKGAVGRCVIQQMIKATTFLFVKKSKAGDLL